MQISQSFFRLFVRSTLVTVFAGAATGGLSGQQIESASQTSLIAANDTANTIGYSSSAGAPEAEAATNFIGATGVSAAMQPPPRRYGRRPVYADSAHNADGSNKYTFFGGAGLTVPTGGSHAYLSPSYNFQVGGGRNFNKNFALLAQFDWANFGLQSGALNNLLLEYQGLCGTGCTGSAITQVGGHSHIWSFTVDPMYTFAQGEKAGAYVIGGAGFYHKIADITTPGVGTYCDYYYGCYQYQADQTIDNYTSNAFGVNGGVGFTYKPSRFGNEKFYAEARYVFTDNKPRPFFDGTTGTSLSSTYFNVFPQNSARTTYIPITVGVRF